MHDGLRGGLVAHLADDIAGWADENDPGALAGLRKIGVLGKKTIAGVDRIRVCLSGGFQNGRNIEIAFLRGRRADPNGFIRQAHVQSAGIGIGKHCNGPVAHRFRRAGNAASNFAAVGDKDFLEWLKKHNGFAAVFATKPYVGQAAVPANREAAAMPKGLLRLRRSFHGKQKIRRLAPTVTDREIQWTFAILLEKFHKLRLLCMSELPDRRKISTEGMKLPFIVVQEFERDAGVILNKRNRVLDQELPNLREAGVVEEIGRAFYEGVALSKAFAEFQETAVRNAFVRKVRSEVVERTLLAVASGEYDFCSFRGGHETGFIQRMEFPIRVEPYEADVVDRLLRASKEDVDDRKCAGEFWA